MRFTFSHFSPLGSSLSPLYYILQRLLASLHLSFVLLLIVLLFGRLFAPTRAESLPFTLSSLNSLSSRLNWSILTPRRFFACLLRSFYSPLSTSPESFLLNARIPSCTSFPFSSYILLVLFTHHPPQYSPVLSPPIHMHVFHYASPFLSPRTSSWSSSSVYPPLSSDQP